MVKILIQKCGLFDKFLHLGLHAFHDIGLPISWENISNSCGIFLALSSSCCSQPHPCFLSRRLGHCCSILVGFTLALIARLNLVHRCAASPIGRISKYAYVTA